jgi:hypothetical protein
MLQIQEFATETRKWFRCNRRMVSQAGRRGFESRLPLHKINKLREISEPQRAKNHIQFEVDGTEVIGYEAADASRRDGV